MNILNKFRNVWKDFVSVWKRMASGTGWRLFEDYFGKISELYVHEYFMASWQKTDNSNAE